MTFASLFSGIGGFDLAAQRVGMTPGWSCEINAQCRSVLRRHFSSMNHYTDVRGVRAMLEPKNASRVSNIPIRPDAIFGGFPCQDLSVAGKRAGLAGSRSGLWFVFRRILGVVRPQWFCIENVPGLLSSNQGRDMRVIADALGQLGYGWAMRVLDAQWFGVPQRRKRVFIVGCLGDRRRACEVLFESNSLPWDSPPSPRHPTRRWEVKMMLQITLVVSVLFLALVVYWQRKDIIAIRSEHDSLKRSVFYHQTLEAIYWKPRIHQHLPPDDEPGEYAKAVDMAGNEWFPGT